MCKDPSVSTNTEADSAYGYTDTTFFAFETTKGIMDKVGHTLRTIWDMDLPVCIAVYDMDLESSFLQCPRIYERFEPILWTLGGILNHIRATVMAAEGQGPPSSLEAGKSR